MTRPFDACPEACTDVLVPMPPYEWEQDPDGGGTAHYECLNCGHRWWTSWGTWAAALCSQDGAA